MESSRTLTRKRKTVPLTKSNVIRLVKKGGANPKKPTEPSVEILKEGQECPFCRFTQLKREGDQIVCTICGYGSKSYT